MASLRIYLAGRVCVESDGRLTDEGCLNGRQGRLALVMLAAERHRPVTRDELAEELWGDALPPSWERALRVVMSKLRSVLTRCGLSPDALAASFGCYQLILPPDTWVDLEIAANAVHEGETALRDGDLNTAYVQSQIAWHITRRPLLLGDSGPWLSGRQQAWHALSVRAVDAVARACAGLGERANALGHAERGVALEPLREAGWRLLMQLYLEDGNRAEALRAYERCRSSLVEELGVGPCAETEALYSELLHA